MCYICTFETRLTTNPIQQPTFNYGHFVSVPKERPERKWHPVGRSTCYATIFCPVPTLVTLGFNCSHNYYYYLYSFHQHWKWNKAEEEAGNHCQHWGFQPLTLIPGFALSTPIQLRKKQEIIANIGIAPVDLSSRIHPSRLAKAPPLLVADLILSHIFLCRSLNNDACSRLDEWCRPPGHLSEGYIYISSVIKCK